VGDARRAEGHFNKIVENAAQLQSSVHKTELLLFFTLLQLSVIVLAPRLFGTLSVRCANSRAVGQIVAGIVLGPSLFGLLWPAGFEFVFRSGPAEPMTILSQIGLILLLSQVGLEFDFSHLREARNRRAVSRTAALGAVFPFVLGFAFGQFSAPAIFAQGSALGYSLFCGTAFSITALPVLGRILLELGLHRTKVAAVAIAQRPSTTWWDGCCWRWYRPWPLLTSPLPTLRSRSGCWLSTSGLAGG
jgi:K+:H+ antiporter